MMKLTHEDPTTRSSDVVEANIDSIRALFPEAFSDGEIDFEVLSQLLGGEVSESEEKYGLNWFGKRRARQLALTPSTGTLRPSPEDSINWDRTSNLLIEGDNLEVLKLLQKSYATKVKLIYIDPPYNTGGDFVYSDDYNDSIANYLKITGQKTDTGESVTSNTEASGRFHTNWLSMMLPRLRLARNLLTPDGVLLVSINDVEVATVRFLLDEIFGEENFLATFVWNNDGNIDQQSKIKGVHEYIVAYGRDAERVARPTVIDPNIEESSKLYNDQIENSITKNGPANPPSEVVLPAGFPAAFESGAVASRSDKWPHILDDIEVEESKLTRSAVVESGWSSKNLLELFIANGCIPIEDSTGRQTWFAMTRTGAIYGYKRRSELQGHVLSVIRNVGTTKQNSSMLAKCGIKFSYPKPVLLLQYLAQIFTTPGGDDFVLDFFAGSGTMGDAILRLNAQDGGDRRFALVQLPEPIDDNSSPDQTLFDLCRKRIECAIGELGSGADGTYHPDGFRVFKLDSTNIREWDPAPDDLGQAILESVEHVKGDRSESDILYEMLLKLGLDLCVPIEKRSIATREVHSIGAGVLFACLTDDIAGQDVEALSLGIVEWRNQLTPAGDTTCVFRDDAFEDDVAKTNLAAILGQHGISTVRSL